MSTIHITVNGNAHALAQGMTLAELLHRLHPDFETSKSPIATAVNNQHVARLARAAFVLGDDDAVTTFEPITGG